MMAAKVTKDRRPLPSEPVGIICGVVPTTNPTFTAIVKALISLKTRNGIVFSPHPRARNSTCEAARIVLGAAVEAGAPPGVIGWIDHPSVEPSNALQSADVVDVHLPRHGAADV
jgi:acetaldehyde dehydrogenase/alcohol dehydrogenase